jgi:hypothetical protein
VATSEPVVLHHGREGGGAGHDEARPSSTTCWAARVTRSEKRYGRVFHHSIRVGTQRWLRQTRLSKEKEHRGRREEEVTKSHKLDPIDVELVGWNLQGKRRPAS